MSRFILTFGRAFSRAVAVASAIATLAIAGGARAQSATPLERYQPAPIGDALFASPAAGIGEHFAVDAGLLFSFADAPLALRRLDGATGTYTDAGKIVSYQAVLHLRASVSLASRVKIEADVPMTVAQGGDSPSVGGVSVASPSGSSMNDLRVGARFVALPQYGLLPAASLSFSAWMPSGDESAYTSSGSARFEPRLVIGADYERLVWSASVGRMFSDPSRGLLGSEVTFAGGVAGRIDRFQIGPEVFGSVLVDREPGKSEGSPVALSQRGGASLEALLGAKGQFGPLTVGLAGGLGFLRGPGTPDFRLIGEISIRPQEIKKAPPGWSPFGDEAKEVAKGTDGSSAVKPATKPAAGDAASVKPPPDMDGDTVPDADDACPRIVGDPSPGAKKRGCPPDRDGDGIWDAEDRCPDRPGVVADGDKNGCPPDTDGDTIVDPDDACPNEKGPATQDPKTSGCPTSVRVEGSQIVILQQVNFETAKSRILPQSFSLLQQVADVLAQHPEIARVAIDGHTDDRGAVASNLELSRSRAVSVMRWLTEKGVDARRLEARGFGPKRPIDDNKTEAGRAKNRRVEFQIKKRTDKGAAGWVDGPIE